MTETQDVTTTLADDHVSATGFVPASADVVFDFLRRPSNHAMLSGDGSVKGVTTGDEALQLGSKFGMKMKMGVPYRISSKVVEFDQGRLIAWCHLGGHRWRWELEPVDGGTKVTETFDMSTAKFPPALRLAGYPKRHEDNVSGSVRNLITHFST